MDRDRAWPSSSPASTPAGSCSRRWPRSTSPSRSSSSWSTTPPTTPRPTRRWPSSRRDGVRVIRQDANCGAAAARGPPACAPPRAPFVFPLDADDLAIPGRITRAADLLDADPERRGLRRRLRGVRQRRDRARGARTARPLPDRVHQRVRDHVAVPPHARSSATAAGATRCPTHRGYEDWNLWMDLAQDGRAVVHLRRRDVPPPPARARARPASARTPPRRDLPRAARRPPAAVRRPRRARRRTTLSAPRKLLYPSLYGERKLLNRMRFVKPLLDRAGDLDARRSGSARRYVRTSSRCRPTRSRPARRRRRAAPATRRDRRQRREQRDGDQRGAGQQRPAERAHDVSAAGAPARRPDRQHGHQHAPS